MIKKDNKFSVAFYTLFFIFFTIIMFLSPHSVDDTLYDYLDLNNFFDILHYAAGYGNGRVLGNMITIYLCKSNIIAAVFRGLTVTLMVYLLSKIISDNDNQKKITAPIVSASLIGIGGIFFGEVFAWISAFTNYTLPILAVLICIDRIKSCNKFSLGKFIIVFVCGYAGQLFSENSSLNNFIVACSILVFCFLHNKSKLAIAINFTAATALGAATMVLCRLCCKDERAFYGDSVYADSMSLKGIAHSVIDNAIKYTQWFSLCKILLILLSAALIIIISKSSSKKMIKRLLCTALILYPAYSFLYLSVNDFVDFFNKLGYFQVLLAMVLTVLYFAAVIYAGCLLKAKYKRKFLFTILFAIFTAVYLLVLSPINSRCLFYTYCVILIAVFIAGKAAFAEIHIDLKFIQITFCVVTAAIFAFLISVYANIFVMDNKVNSYIEQQIEQGSTTVAVCRVTNTDYFHHSYYSSRLGWKYYQNEPKDVEFEEISMDEWLKNYSLMN